MGIPILDSVLSFFGTKSANDAAAANAKAYNDWLGGRAGNVNDIISKLKANGIDIFGPQTTTQQGTSAGTQNSSTAYNQNSSSRPVITSEYQPLEGDYRNILQQRLENPTAVGLPEQLNAAMAINRGSAGAAQAVKNAAARYGKSAAQVGAGLTPIEVARNQQISQYLGTTVPELNRSRQNEDLSMAQGAINAFGKGEDTSTSGVSRTSGTTTNTSMGSTTGAPDYNSLLNFLTAPGPQATGKTGQNPFVNAGQSLSNGLSQAIAAAYGLGA